MKGMTIQAWFQRGYQNRSLCNPTSLHLKKRVLESFTESPFLNYLNNIILRLVYGNKQTFSSLSLLLWVIAEKARSWKKSCGMWWQISTPHAITRGNGLIPSLNPMWEHSLTCLNSCNGYPCWWVFSCGGCMWKPCLELYCSAGWYPPMTWWFLDLFVCDWINDEIGVNYWAQAFVVTLLLKSPMFEWLVGVHVISSIGHRVLN